MITLTTAGHDLLFREVQSFRLKQPLQLVRPQHLSRRWIQNLTEWYADGTGHMARREALARLGIGASEARDKVDGQLVSFT